jgi:protein SCO1/2
MRRGGLPAALVAVAVAAGAATLGGCGGSHANASPASISPASGSPASGSTVPLHGAVPQASTPKPEFVLTDTSGQRYDFDARTAGKATLLYFGYTHCPDQCPTSMADVAAALRLVPASVASQVVVVFVTTDPWRDTRRVLRGWLNRFSAEFVGLTGTPTQVAAAQVAVGMPISQRVPAGKGAKAGQYSVNHFAAVLAFGRDNRLATLYPSGVAPTDIAADLPELIKG